MIKIPKTDAINGTKNINTITKNLDLSNFIAFQMKKGISCKIMNGHVCDVNGNPFINSYLQDEAAFITERALNSKIIILGRVVPSASITYSFNDLAEIECALNSSAKRHSDIFSKYSIEIYDFMFEIEPETISYGTKRMMLYSMARHFKNDGYIYVSPSIKNEALNEESLKAFMSTNAYSGKETALYDMVSSDVSSKFSKKLLLDPFEVVSRPITYFEKFDTSDELGERVKFIAVSFDDYELKIPMIRVSRKWSRYIHTLLKNKLINTFTFRAMYSLDENKYRCATVL